ncbi:MULTISPECIES: cobalt ECF transporter T component CbiQ [Thermomonospora]|uniref:Cobalt ABC transporter, inner membrane subunit CbiQ n=1 Tax=Thermomonospora curvata (strain ATCC 19995 / DSM 43183 / JCM 3096 / KCTC 9072 / NBRC 15933 / NCIMB 10081 / Henssen B9) TaxID=471852 RepID=D1A9Z9_THECD|nr:MULTISPECIES: cobalt ECF transporter T component CbiQ [Thermomonospora]ACY96935.1 cobalt ABC transporter, inner membrane subunit CbiQ [Thermomonospora curvata DSM 43183]PKK15214.1 MAG: cobalt ECF transporter T component CbiQ [Thermomonospora sp. CIF 1]
MTGLGRRLYLPEDTPLHRLPPQCKLAAAGAFVLAVVCTPREAVWAFGVYALMLAAVAALARVRPGFLLRRMVIEVPFVAFALLLPLVARGPQVQVLGLTLSESGLWSAWNILAKATLGTVSSLLLAATTEPRRLLIGLQHLRVPPLLVQIATFMFRYADVIVAEMQRMKVARAARGFQARDVRAFGVLARSAGALFLRSYERGERVYLAMLSRGYDGRMPVLHDSRAGAAQWAGAALLPAAAALVALSAWMVT